MKNWIFFLVVFLFGNLLGIAQDNRPNILFILVDDLNDWQGFMGGHPNAFTPHMDKLSQKGLTFTNAHCDAPICNPSRTSLLSGIAPYKNGVYNNIDNWRDSKVLQGINDLPRHLQNNGYYTMGVGKLFHHNSWPADWEQAFDEYGGRLGGHNFRLFSPEFDYPWAGIEGSSNYAFHWGPIDYPEAEELSDPKLAAWSVERLKKDYEKPFFMMVGFHSPHTPLTSPREFHERFNNEEVLLPPVNENDLEDMPVTGRQIATAGSYDMPHGTYSQAKDRNIHHGIVKNYLAACTYVDAQIGKVLEALEKSKHRENTIVILTSDHGWSLGQHTHFRKYALWEPETHVPFIIYQPNHKTNGLKTDEMVSLLDIYPTIIDWAQLPPPGHQLDGKSLKPLLEDPQYKFDKPNLITLGRHNQAVRDKRWKYIRYIDGGEELYDLLNDPHEWHNLTGVKRHARIKSKLAAHLPAENVPALNSDHELPLELNAADNFRNFNMISDKFINKPIRIRADIKSRTGEGVILTMESNFSGFSLYVQDNKLYFSVMDVPSPLQWNNLYPARTIIKSDMQLPEVPFTAEAFLAPDGEVRLKVNGEVIGSGRAKTLSVHPAGAMTVGDVSGLYIPSGYYPLRFNYKTAFQGEIEKVIVDNK